MGLRPIFETKSLARAPEEEEAGEPAGTFVRTG